MYLNVANDIPIVVGDIVNWNNQGQLGKWIIFKKEEKVNGTYQTFSIVKCNYLMKWIDKLGHLQQSWSYFVSSMDSKIKENFRTWNSLRLLATYLVKGMIKAVELLETSKAFFTTT